MGLSLIVLLLCVGLSSDVIKGIFGFRFGVRAWLWRRRSVGGDNARLGMSWEGYYFACDKITLLGFR
jgi:hypothetical protein